MIRSSSDIRALKLEDYIAVKEKAYEFFVKNNGTLTYDAKYINKYITDVLEFDLDDAEAIVFSSTALVPFDQEVCKLYHCGEKVYSNFKRQNLIYGKAIDLKKIEISYFGLDRLIDDNILTPPPYEPFVPEKAKKN